MSQRNTEYETLYNVGLLDDIHNYFPDLLYNSGRFSGVQEVLEYLRQNTQQRFDLYSFGLRDYQSRHVPPPRQERVVTPPARIRVRQRVPVVESEPAAPAVSVTQQQAPLPLRTRAYLYQTDDRDDSELRDQLEDLVNYMQAPLPRTTRTNSALNIFSNLFGALNSPATVPLGGLDILSRQATGHFMEPVVVRPTQEQIDRGSRVDTLAVESPDNCAICQDHFEAHANRRTLTTCGHAFHMSCIDEWFQQNVHCPVCRHDIREVEESQ